MVQHVVMWTLREGLDKAETLAQFRRTFADFDKKVPGCLSLDIHGGFSGYDVCLISRHTDRAALEVYQNHPVHLEAKKFVHSVIDARAACDFELDN